MSDERSYLGRGLDDISGKPFGWAWHKERDEIRAHLRRRVWRFYVDAAGPGTPGMRLEARVDAIQRRIHRDRPRLAERQRLAAARRPAPAGNAVWWSWAELERMVEHFAGSNDEVGQAIADKARAAIEHRA